MLKGTLRRAPWLCALLVGCGGQAAKAPKPATKPPSALSPEPAAGAGQAGLPPTPLEPPAPSETTSSRADEGSSELGGPGAVALEALSPDGRWIAYCQATTDTNGDGKLSVVSSARGQLVGDLPDVYVTLGGKPERVDELLAYDATGRWLILLRGEQADLVDAVTRTRTSLAPLSPDLRSDEMFEVAHRSFAFDAAGERLLVLSHTGRLRYEAHLIDLPAVGSAVDLSRSRKLTLPPGEIWRVLLPADGAQIIIHTLPQESGTSRSLRWPAPLRKTPLRRCHGPVTQAGAWAQRGGEITTLIASTRDPTLQVAPGFVLPLGNGWLRREKNGRLLLVREGTQKQVASERCGARIVHVDPARELFLISCEHYALERPKDDSAAKRAPPKFRFELYLVAPGFVKDLEADLSATQLDLQPSKAPRLVPLRPGARSVLIDMDRRRLLELGADDRIVATHEAKALVRRGAKLVVYDADTGGERQIAASVAAFPSIIVQDRFVFVEPYLVDLGEARVHLTHHGAPVGLTRTGKLLVPSAAATDRSWAEGPLRWLAAESEELSPTARPPARAPSAPSL